ncbi:hypothetical protein V8C86DRAFT_2468384 [Haematococcus lacustris]
MKSTSRHAQSRAVHPDYMFKPQAGDLSKAAHAVPAVCHQPWWRILEALRYTPPQTPAFEQMVTASLQAARCDAEWADSGIVEKLGKLLHSKQAAVEAVEILAWHEKVGERAARYARMWQADEEPLPVESSPSSSKSSSNYKRSKSLDDVFPVPPPRLPKRQCISQPASPALQPSVSQQWSGTLRLVSPTCSCDISCSIQLPDNTSSSALPPTVECSHMVPRRGVMLGKHHVCRTLLRQCGSSQASYLRLMAVQEVVSVALVDSLGIAIFVPFLEGSFVRAVTFLLPM